MATAKTQTEVFNRLIVDVANGTETIVEMTAEEIAEMRQREAEQIAAQSAAAAKAAARQSALAKLAELGLTEEEIAAL